MIERAFVALTMLALASACGDDTSSTNSSSSREGGAGMTDASLDAATDPDARAPLNDAGNTGDGGGGPCTNASDCDDGLYCNGQETCDEGTCQAGTPPADDGISCTVDACDEGSQRISNTPNDDLCNGLDSADRCGSGGSANLIVKDVGVCDAKTGCKAMRQTVENCDGSIPGNHPYCGGVTWHHNAKGACSGGGTPTCGFTESTTTCSAPGPSCSGGVLTTSTATCADSTGCGVSSGQSSCPDQSSTCTGGGGTPVVLTTYAPACANGTSCGSATPTATTCTASNTCSNRVYQQRSPTCNATTESCGTKVDSTTDCKAADDCLIQNFGAACVIYVATGTCSAASGCDSTTSQIVCDSAMGQSCTCSGTPRCVQN
ncbi:MAG: hypothetical protein KC416_02040 [Myxococcales bacterium]|nr:hypothetical protein [Myxococcales bacterium]